LPASNVVIVPALSTWQSQNPAAGSANVCAEVREMVTMFDPAPETTTAKSASGVPPVAPVSRVERICAVTVPVIVNGSVSASSFQNSRTCAYVSPR
jgi:hypothetical protein